jgi:hypothetical protein
METSMKEVGLLLLGLAFGCMAAYFGYAGLTMDTTVPSADIAAGEGVANLQLMHVQMLDIVISVGAAIVSAIFFVGGAVVAELAPSAE